MIRFSQSHKWISVCPGDIWSKWSISQKIVPRNRNSKSMEGKQFINVRLGTDIVIAPIAWSKLMQSWVVLAFVCHFQAERFHTLKIESDFFSRQGLWTLCRTSVYHGLLLKKNQRRSSFYFLTKMVQSTLNRLGGCLWKKRKKGKKKIFLFVNFNLWFYMVWSC